MKLCPSFLTLTEMTFVLLGCLASMRAEETATHHKTLLIVANLEGNENLGGSFADPEIVQALASKGWIVEARGLNELTPEHYAAADAVVYIQQPYRGNRPGVEIQRAFIPGFLKFIEGGGNALVLFDDRYFHVFEPFNEWLGPLGARVVREQVIDSNKANLGTLQVDRDISYILTQNLNREHPLTRDIERFSLIKRGGGEMSYPIVFAEPWVPLVSAEATARSEDTWAKNESSYPSAPVIIATRPLGRGSLTVSGIHSGSNFLHGSHRRFDGGFFLRNGHADFLLNWIESAGRRSSRISDTMPPAVKTGPRGLIEFKPVSDQSPKNAWQRGFILELDALPKSLDVWRDVLLDRVDWVAVSVPGEGMPKKEDLEAWRALCETVSSDKLRFLPATRVRDSFGNAFALIAPVNWPLPQGRQRAMNHIAREIDGHPVILDVHSNPWPVENIGGFQGFPFITYRNGVRDIDLKTYRYLQAEDWFLIPHVVVEGSSPEAVSGLLADGMHLTYIPAETPAQVMNHIPYIFHNPREAFVSSGPRIMRAKLAGPGLVEDPWEGEYYLWSGPQDEARYHAVVEGLTGNMQLRIHRNRLLWRQYPTKDGRWELDLPFQSTEAAHNYWLEVWAGDELVAISTVSRSRPLRHTAHGGGDRMNLYHKMSAPGSDGNLLMRGGQRFLYGHFGFNIGWGDTLETRPPVKGREWSPDGYEWGNPTIGISQIRLAPQVRLPGQPEFGVSKPHRAGYALAAEEMAVLRESVDRMEVLVDGQRKVVPTAYLSAHSTYYIPPWSLDGISTMLVTTTLRTKQDVTLPPGEGVRWVEAITRSPNFWDTLSVRSGGTWQHLKRRDTKTTSGQFEAAVLWPDPAQSIILIPQPGAFTRLQVRDTTGGPSLSLSTYMEGGDWDVNSTITFSYLYAATSQKDTDIEAVLEPALALWRPDDPSVLLNLSRGRLRDWFGFPRVSADRSAVAYKLGTIPEKLVLPIAVEGLYERWPAWLAGVSWRPLAQLEGTAYATHFPDASGSSFQAGSLVMVSNPAIQIDVRRLASRTVDLWVHNPTTQPQRFEITPVLTAGKPKTLLLQPGEDHEVRFELP